jgi:hypothetical protein
MPDSVLNAGAVCTTAGFFLPAVRNSLLSLGYRFGLERFSIVIGFNQNIHAILTNITPQTG